MIQNEKKFQRKLAPEGSAQIVEKVCGCKWSMTVYHLIANGINRPGEMVRNTEGLSTKVLNQCLRRNVEFGILNKLIYNESPPRVEYEVTQFGEKFLDILAQLETLQEEIQDIREAD